MVRVAERRHIVALNQLGNIRKQGKVNKCLIVTGRSMCRLSNHLSEAEAIQHALKSEVQKMGGTKIINIKISYEQV